MINVSRPHLDTRFNAVLLRGHLKMLAAGMKNSQLSGTKILAKASELTGRKYKRGQYTNAITDLNNLIEELTNA
jgi:hypothetical protein